MGFYLELKRNDSKGGRGRRRENRREEEGKWRDQILSAPFTAGDLHRQHIPKNRHVGTKPEVSICLFSGRREAAGEILQGGWVLFSPWGRNQEYFYFTVYSTCPFFLMRNSPFVYSPLQECLRCTDCLSHSSWDANSPQRLVLTPLLNKNPSTCLSPFGKQKYWNKISESIKSLLFSSTRSDSSLWVGVYRQQRKRILHLSLSLSLSLSLTHTHAQNPSQWTDRTLFLFLDGVWLPHLPFLAGFCPKAES